jgi:phage replication-related protein YjqB (UPF0714/DUF867 family)
MNTVSRFVSPKFAIFAIHGGNIEPGTKEIAEQIASDDLSLYFFEGESGEDHISSDSYEEPKALELASKVETIISIHGEKNTEESFVMVGGLEKELSQSIEDKLREAGFIIKEAPDELDADNPENICNRGQKGEGVQIEISRRLRKELGEDKDLQTKFTEAIREVLIFSHSTGSR